jgi:hypothetical protein
MRTATLATLVCSLFSAAAPAQSRLPDLDVTHIERTPKYNPIPWVYPEKGPQYQGAPKTKQPYTAEQLRQMKERPAPGDMVTFTAHLVNASDAPAPDFTGQWLLDDKSEPPVQGKPLGPWEKTTLELRWKWMEGPHTVRFVVDPGNKTAEACKKNNSIADRTDALALQMRVTPQLYDAFRKTPNKLGSRSFEDFVQRHILIMNNAFAACAYPGTCAQGILERVRVDDFAIMSKEEMKRLPQSMGCDGGWNFYDDAFPAWFNGHVNLDLTTGVDWGLIHELTHQLGVIDLYAIVVGAHWNHVRGRDGQPFWLGYGGSQPCVMSGSGIRTLPDGAMPPPLTLKVDADGSVTAGEKHSFMGYSEHTAGGLNSLRGKRRGHFGLYLFDLPKKSFVQILDNSGRTVEGANVTVYQQAPQPGPQSIPAKPTMSGKTDREGLFALAEETFGDINPIGLNGILLFCIEARGHTEHRFLDITQFNLAKWQGLDPFTAMFRTGIPAEGAPPPVENLRIALWETLPNKPVTLAWDYSPAEKPRQYNVYRVFAPQYHSISFQSRYEKVASVPGNVVQAEVQPPPGYAGVTDVPCFMVTAVDARGRESGYTDDRRLTRFAFPGGTAKIERLGPAGKTVRVALGPQSLVHLRESMLVEKDTRLQFRFRTRSQSPATLQFQVAGLGETRVALVEPAASGGPLLQELRGLNDGSWKTVDLPLRTLLDALAAQRKVKPADARTTWDHDWVITDVRFGHLSPGGGGGKPEIYEFEE